MGKYVMEKKFKNPLVSGALSVIAIVIIASVGWVLWSNIVITY